MAEASIPVDLFNPGQVFACLGFLEAADILLGDAEGGFDLYEADVRFRLTVSGNENPFAVVLGFLAEAEVYRVAPYGYTTEPATKQEASEDGGDDEPEQNETLELSDAYPAREADRLALPIRLHARGRPTLVEVSHWADGSSREDFKLYSGNRSAFGIARAMLSGTRNKPKKKQTEGDPKTHGLSTLWATQCDDLTARPFDVLTSVGGSFNFDPRGAWTALDAGYSPNQHNHGVAASPVVEILAAIALEHTRPDEYEKRKVRYAAWGALLPPILARPAIAGTSIAVPVRRFRFDLAMSGKNKIVTFAREETRT